MRGSWLDRSWFFPVVIASLVAGHAFDLLGTYLYQPDFAHESNHLYTLLKPYGLRLNWPLVIAGKAVFCGLWALGLALFLKRRRQYYPKRPATFRVLMTQFFYGRPLGWFENFFKLPRSWTPGLLGISVIVCLGGPYYAYLGYANLASKYDWWRLGGFWYGRFWWDHGLFIALALDIALFCWLLWRDFQAEDLSDVSPLVDESV
jgi:hypothetical protein